LRGKLLANCTNCGAELPEGAQFCTRCGTPISVETTSTRSISQPSLVLAFWGERFVAWLIDVIIIGILTAVLGLLSVLNNFTIFPSWLNWFPFFNFGFSGWIIFVYWAIADGIYGQSLGKMVMRIKVVHPNGKLPGLGFGALESFGKAFLLPIDLIIGWLLYPRKRQRIFNALSNTIVVKT
jgi:uncharacterized RDD family membrane protein YckC